MTCTASVLTSVEEHTDPLQHHLVSICDAIARMRQEITELRHEQEAGRACDELTAVVQGTEKTTNTILTASETVAALAIRLARRAEDQATKDDAAAIQAEMQTIFEICNFQDLTGQSITKVVRTIGLVEEHVAEMLRLWAGSASTTAVAPARQKPVQHAKQNALLSGPAPPLLSSAPSTRCSAEH